MAPLLLWLLGKEPQKISTYVHSLNSALYSQLPVSDPPDSAATFLNVWGMMDLTFLAETPGDLVRVFTFTGEKPSEKARHRFDLDVLAEIGLEQDFMHYAKKREWEQRDVLLIWGNLLLTKLETWKRHFNVRLLSVEPESDEMASLSIMLRTPIDVIGNLDAFQSKLESTIMQHVIDVGIASNLENKDLLSHPFFAASVEVAVKTTLSCKLRLAQTKKDKFLIERSFCKIEPLRQAAKDETESSSDGGSVDEGGNPRPVKKAKNAAASSAQPTSAVVKEWLLKELIVDASSGLQWGAMRKKAELHFKARVSNSMLLATGFKRFKSNGKTFVLDEAGNRMNFQ